MIITGIAALVWVAAGLGVLSVGLMSIGMFAPGIVHFLF
jgi:hypothetical protein